MVITLQQARPVFVSFRGYPMLIGVPKEMENTELRIGLTPTSVIEAVVHGHQVFIESNAGVGIGKTDQYYD